MSDHCPLFLEEKVTNWGPKPFKSLNSWFDHPGFLDFVKEKWMSYKVEGWGGFIIKEKLKLLKSDVKEWNAKVFGRIEDRISARKEEIFKLDMLDDAFGLEEEEVICRNKERALLILDEKMRSNTLQQKAKLNWIKTGDLNSATFHKFHKRKEERK